VRLDRAFDYPKDWRECLKLVGDDKHGFHDPLLYATQRLAKELYRTYGPDFDDLLAPCLAQFDAATRGDRPQSYIDQCKHDLARMVHGAIAQFEANKHRKAGERAPIEPQYPDTALPFEEANAETRNGIAYWFEECAKAHEMDRLQREAKQAWIDKGCPEPTSYASASGKSEPNERSNTAFPYTFYADIWPHMILAADVSLGMSETFMRELLLHVDLSMFRVPLFVASHAQAEEAVNRFNRLRRELGVYAPDAVI
jgi:hypothetical protein